MRKIGIAVAIGGLVTMPLAAMAQSIASAPNSKTEHIVFMESGTDRVPASAMSTLRSAADAAKTQSVRIEGRAEHAAAVKQELVRQGAPAQSITVTPVAAKPLVKVGDGVSDPTERRVEIKF